MRADTPTGVRLVLTTCSDVATAQALGNELVERRLVACATMITGAASIYRWEGKVTADPEVLMLLKTAADRVDALKAALDALHPYDLPECVVFDARDGLDAYLGWVHDETRPPQPER